MATKKPVLTDSERIHLDEVIGPALTNATKIFVDFSLTDLSKAEIEQLEYLGHRVDTQKTIYGERPTGYRVTKSRSVYEHSWAKD